MGKENRNASHGENNDKCCLSYNFIYNHQLWAIGYNLSSLWALNLIVKLLTIIYSHFRSLT